MTQDKAKKKAVRQQMAETGEPYNVARRSIESAGTPADHLIGDDETRRIAESFLSVSPWLGTTTWQDILAGPGAGYKADWDGAFSPETELDDGQHWSWSATFADPSGQQKTLTHETVLKGIRALIFGEDRSGIDGLRLIRVKQWFTEPAAERRKIALGPSDSSRICQQALYGRQIFATEDDHFGGERPDYFADQRDSPEEDSA